MATVRVAPNEVQVDEVVYTFSDAGIADEFESCVATTGDVAHCAKEQIAQHKRPADRGKLIAEVGTVRLSENSDKDHTPNHFQP